MSTRTIIGMNLRRLRVRVGMSQERLGLAADIDRSYVGRIERGSENVTVDALDKLAEALEVPVRALFDEVDVFAVPERLPSGRKRNDKAS